MTIYYRNLKKNLLDSVFTSNLISKLSHKLMTNIAAKIRLGAELEFYFTGNIDKFQQFVSENKLITNICYGNIASESGRNQYEVKFYTCDDPLLMAQNIILIKELLHKIATEHGYIIDFSAKPLIDQPGSAMHLHISLHQDQLNLFANQAGKEQNLLQYAISGLCHLMGESMIFFANNHHAYRRIVPYFNAPINISWGGIIEL